MAFVDLESDVRGAYKGDEPFESASLVKLPVLVELYRRADAGELKLSEEMVFEEKFRVGGSGSMQKGPAGSRWTLEKLGEIMITESDNVATDMLLARLGMPSLEAAMKKLGLKHTTVRRTIFDFDAINQGRDNLTSADDLVILLEGIAREKLPGAATMRKILEGTHRHDMLPAKLPKGTKLAHKSGELTGVLHDAGIITTPEGSYILVLLAQAYPDKGQQMSDWANASLKVYQAYTKPLP